MRLAGDLPDIEVFEEVGSTNDLARERALAGASHGAAVRARVQRAGRGQQGHRWASPQGGLYLSVVLWPEVDPTLLSGISAACGIGVVRALDEAGAEGLRLKWPNDIVRGCAKLGGILVEAGQADGRAFAVCGVGINIQTPQVMGGSPGALAATGLAACLPAGAEAPTPAELAGPVRARIVEAVDEWAGASQGASAPLLGISGAYHGVLAFQGEPVELITKDGSSTLCGTFLGVDGYGRARVQLGDGQLAICDSAQYSLRPA